MTGGWTLSEGARAAAAGLLVAACVAGHAEGQGPGAGWDFAGSAGVQEMWTENTTYTAAPGNGDAVTSLILTGRSLYSSPRAKLDGYYTPSAQFYRDRPTLNNVAHTGRVSLGWSMSARSVLTVSDQFSYTPEQGVTASSFQSPVVFTRFSDRRANTAGASWRLNTSPSTALVTDVRRNFQSYSDPNRVDWSGTTSSLSLDRAIGRRSGVQIGAAYAWNRFSQRVCDSFLDPNDPSQGCAVYGRDHPSANVESAFTSARYDLTPQANVTGRVGYNLVLPGDSRMRKRRGVQASANLTWTGSRVNALAGYHHDISAGSGVLSLSRSGSGFLNVGMTFHPDLRADLTFNRTNTRSLDTNRNSDITSYSGQTVLTWRIRRSLNATASFARHVQQSAFQGAPNLAFNRVAVGLAAAFN